MLCQKLVSEHRKNQDIHKTIARLMQELQLPLQRPAAAAPVEPQRAEPAPGKSRNLGWLYFTIITVLLILIGVLISVIVVSLPFHLRVVSG